MVKLELSDRGFRVRCVQALLKKWGFMDKVDGYFDSITKKAVIDLQKKVGFEPDGIWSEGLVKYLKASGFAPRDVNVTGTDPAYSANQLSGGTESSSGSEDGGSDSSSDTTGDTNTSAPKAKFSYDDRVEGWSDQLVSADEVAAQLSESTINTGSPVLSADNGSGDAKIDSPKVNPDTDGKVSELVEDCETPAADKKDKTATTKLVNTEESSGATSSTSTAKTTSWKPPMTGGALMCCRITDCNTGTAVSFEGIPEDVTDANQANFTPINVKGRSAPFQDYENSGPRHLSFSYELFADYAPNHQLRAQVNTIRAFCYPQKGQNIQPSTALFTMGAERVSNDRNQKDDLSIKVIIQSVNVQWRKPIIENWFSRALITLNMIEVVDSSQEFKDVANRERWI